MPSLCVFESLCRPKGKDVFSTNNNNKKTSVTGRTLYYFGRATLGHWPYFLLDFLTSTGYAYFLTFGNPLIIARIIDRINTSHVTADQVFPVFGPHIFALIMCNVLGQVCSKLQDYSLWKLQILVYYDLSSMCFDVLANQSMTFHNNRYGGSLVSQTSKFTSAYNQLMQTLTYSVIPAAATVVFIIVILLPLVPLYVLIVAVFLIIYCMVVYHLFKKLQKLNAETAGALSRPPAESSTSAICSGRSTRKSISTTPAACGARCSPELSPLP